MFQRLTTILILSALTVQAVFGGLQHSVSICLGGGHEHESTEIVEHCDMECSHHDQWATPIGNEVDFEDCACTDLELNLITLLSTPRNADDNFIANPLVLNSVAILSAYQLEHLLRGPPTNIGFDFGIKQQQLVSMRTTRLLL